MLFASDEMPDRFREFWMQLDETKLVNLWRGFLEGREPESSLFCRVMLRRAAALYRRYGHGEEFLKDLLQSFMLRLLEKDKSVARTYDPARAPLWGYFRVVAYHHMVASLRLEDRRKKAEIPLSEILELPAHQPTDGRIKLRELRSAIDEMPRWEERFYLLLRIEHGLKEREISEIFEVAPGTVSTRIRRGRRQLREIMRRRGYDVPGD